MRKARTGFHRVAPTTPAFASVNLAEVRIALDLDRGVVDAEAIEHRVDWFSMTRLGSILSVG